MRDEVDEIDNFFRLRVERDGKKSESEEGALSLTGMIIELEF